MWTRRQELAHYGHRLILADPLAKTKCSACRTKNFVVLARKWSFSTQSAPIDGCCQPLKRPLFGLYREHTRTDAFALGFHVADQSMMPYKIEFNPSTYWSSNLNRLEKFLIRLAISGRIPFSRQFLAWSSRRWLEAMGPASFLRYGFEIPDPSQPIPEDERGAVGPSAHLIPFVPETLAETDVVGRRLDEVLTNVGTYGMGGPGFFGLRFEDEWLVVAIWGAGEWIRVDGILVDDHFFEKSERPRPWISNGADRLSPLLVGTEITSLKVYRKRCAAPTLTA